MVRFCVTLVAASVAFFELATSVSWSQEGDFDERFAAFMRVAVKTSNSERAEPIIRSRSHQAELLSLREAYAAVPKVNDPKSPRWQLFVIGENLVTQFAQRSQLLSEYENAINSNQLDRARDAREGFFVAANNDAIAIMAMAEKIKVIPEGGYGAKLAARVAADAARPAELAKILAAKIKEGTARRVAISVRTGGFIASRLQGEEIETELAGDNITLRWKSMYEKTKIVKTREMAESEPFLKATLGGTVQMKLTVIPGGNRFRMLSISGSKGIGQEHLDGWQNRLTAE